MLVQVAIGIAVLAVGFIAYDHYFRRKKQKAAGRLLRIVLFSKIGNDKVFQGIYRGYEESDDKVGVYIMIEKIKKPISGVSSDDFFPDQEFSKCLMVCKYSEDDYRAMSRMRDGEWFQKVMLSDKEYYQTQMVEDEKTGEEIVQFVMDEHGKPVVKRDEDGEEILPYRLEKYKEPVGVSQSAREAQRFNRDFTNRMRELRGEKSKFWEKWAPYIAMGTMLIIVLLIVGYNTNKMTEVSKYWADKFDENAKEYTEAINKPHWAEQLIESVQRKEKEADAPPK